MDKSAAGQMTEDSEEQADVASWEDFKESFGYDSRTSITSWEDSGPQFSAASQEHGL